jgi:GAF domain-containing protein
MMATVDPVLQALTQAAVDVTAAAEGWLLAVHGDHLRVVAAAGDEPGRALGTTTSLGEGSAGYVVSSGQPLALGLGGGQDRFGSGIIGQLGREPTSVLCVPCTTEHEVIGALELIDKAGGSTFSFDDVELATLLAGIAGVALAGPADPKTAPDPGELAANLERLAASDPARYAAVATAINALLV